MSGRIEVRAEDERTIARLLAEHPELKGFMDYLFAQDVERKTAITYLRKVISLLAESGKTMETVGFADFLSFNASKKDKSSSYKILCHVALSHFSQFLYDSGLASRNFMETIKTPRKKSETMEQKKKRDRKVLSYDQIIEGISRARQCPDEFRRFRDVAMLSVMFFTGVRCETIRMMDISDFDPEKGTILTVEKGGKIRELFLPESACKDVLEYLDFLKREGYETESLFVSQIGKRIITAEITRTIKKWFGGEVTPHWMRASAGTYVYQETGNIRTTQTFLGHERPDTTQLYIRGDGVKEKENEKILKVMELASRGFK